MEEKNMGANQAPKSVFKTMSLSASEKARKRQEKISSRDALSSGQGQYIFENNSRGDLYLPRPTKSGRKMVKKGEQFIGDDYYFQLVKTNELRFIREAVDNTMGNKLITEQPPVVTKEGKVEFVVTSPDEEKMNENKDKNKTSDVLLTEQPIGNIVLVD